MRPECLICGCSFESDTQVGGGSDPKRYWICPDCIRHEKIGRAVDNAREFALEHDSGVELHWIVSLWRGDGPFREMHRAETPLDALRAAGLVKEDGHG